jgi:hypothetical protein
LNTVNTEVAVSDNEESKFIDDARSLFNDAAIFLTTSGISAGTAFLNATQGNMGKAMVFTAMASALAGFAFKNYTDGKVELQKEQSSARQQTGMTNSR